MTEKRSASTTSAELTNSDQNEVNPVVTIGIILMALATLNILNLLDVIHFDGF